MKIFDAQCQISNENNLRNIKQTISFITITHVSCLDSDFLHNKGAGIVQHPPLHAICGIFTLGYSQD
jgi:hypothetical protein